MEGSTGSTVERGMHPSARKAGGRRRRDTVAGALGMGRQALVASFVLAARSNGLSDGKGRDAAIACARSYRRKMRDFAAMDVLDV